MAWHQLSINRPHLVYIILGGFTSIFMLVSLFIKEKLYIGEATVATICGIIFGPHGANLINPLDWGNTDQITLEFSRIVLVVQCFAVGVELPKAYMERHWRSVVFLLVPVMTFGWLITSLFIWWLIPPLSWLESLTVAACVTATDPVLASSVVGKGKFAKRVPKHLRDLLSAESGCNDGMAFPFIYLSLYLIRYHLDAKEVTYHWICYTVLYECIFGAVFGVLVGYIARHAIKFTERKGIIDRESFLVFYFVLALFCAGAGSLLGMDDLLIGFAAGVGFSNDGWFTEKTEESHVSNVIDLLINLAYFVYFGTIIPWNQYSASDYGLDAWRLVVIAILVIFFRRIPIMMMLKPFIPDIKTWREALFAGHFGPIGVGAIFVAILARAELETDGTIPLATLPPPGSPDYNLIYSIWPIVTFLVIASIVVHGSSIAVFTLGKHINTLTITLSYTSDNERSSAWMNRLPRISSQSKSMSRASDEFEQGDFPPGQLPPIGIPKLALRRVREDDDEKPGSRSSSLRPYRRRKKRDRDDMGPGGPISQSAIMPLRMSGQRQGQSESQSDSQNEKAEMMSSGQDSQPLDDSQLDRMRSEDSERDRGRLKREEDREESKPVSSSRGDETPADIEAYEEGHKLIMEDAEGNVLDTVDTGGKTKEEKAGIIENTRQRLQQDQSDRYAKHRHEPHGRDEGEEVKEAVEDVAEHPQKTFRNALASWKGFRQTRRAEDGRERQEPKATHQKRGPAHAYQFGNTIIVEDEDGEVIKKYTIPGQEGEGSRRFNYGNGQVRQGLQRMGTWMGIGREAEQAASETSGVSTEKLRQHEDDISQEESNDLKRILSSSKFRAKRQDDDDAISEDDGLRLTISRTDRYGLTGLQRRKQGEGKSAEPVGVGGGRRMSTKDFIKQMQQLDPKAKVQKVEESDASEDIKRDIRAIARMETIAATSSSSSSSRPVPRRSETTSGASVPTDADRAGDTSGDERTGRRPDPRRSHTEILSQRHSPPGRHGDTGETMDDIQEDDVPTHDLRSTIARRRGQTTTAAELRRQRLSMSDAREQIDEEEEEEEDEVEYADQETPAERRRRHAALGISRDADDDLETPAEKRRRFAALGMSGRDETDSELSDEDVPRNPPLAAVREPDRNVAAAESNVKPRIQWGGERGREIPDREDGESDGGETKGQKMGRKIRGFLNR